MKKIIPILTLLILLALTGCSYKIIKTDDEKNEDINIESLEKYKFKYGRGWKYRKYKLRHNWINRKKQQTSTKSNWKNNH